MATENTFKFSNPNVLKIQIAKALYQSLTLHAFQIIKGKIKGIGMAKNFSTNRLYVTKSQKPRHLLLQLF